MLRIVGAQAALALRPGRPAWLGWWAAVSLGLHGLLLAGIFLVDLPAPAAPESRLRVRLLTAVEEVPVPPVMGRTPLSAPRVSRRLVSRATVPSKPLPAPRAAPLAGDGKHDPAVSPQGAPPSAQSSPPPTTVPGERQEEIAPRVPSTEEGERTAGDGPRPGGVVPQNESMAEPLPVEAKASGVFLVPEGGGSGLPRGGSGGGEGRSGIGGGRGAAASGAQGVGAGGLGGPAVASRGASGPGGGSGLTDMLQAIRRRIEEAKVYPEAARRAGMEGTAEVRFQIGSDGAPVNLEIVRSSGYPELDRASLETIRRAAPYPAVSGRIRIPLAYRLER